MRRLVAGEPLSAESLRSLELAWRFSDRAILRPDDLLPTLLAFGTQSALILEKLGALQSILVAIPTRVRLAEETGASPKLSPEVERLLEFARIAAGELPVETGHLLLGLAEIGHPPVSQLKQRIREALEGS